MATNNAYEIIHSTCVYGGANLTGFKKFEAKENQDKSHNYAASKKPYSVSRKTQTFEGSMSMYFRQAVELIKAANGNGLSEIAPADCTFMARTASGELVKVTLKQMEFKGTTVAFETAADDAEMDVDVIYSDMTIQ